MRYVNRSFPRVSPVLIVRFKLPRLAVDSLVSQGLTVYPSHDPQVAFAIHGQQVLRIAECLSLEELYGDIQTNLDLPLVFVGIERKPKSGCSGSFVYHLQLRFKSGSCDRLTQSGLFLDFFQRPYGLVLGHAKPDGSFVLDPLKPADSPTQAQLRIIASRHFALQNKACSTPIPLRGFRF